MKTKKNEEIKIRVDGATKTAIWQIAINRGLDMSDMVREALRDFIAKDQGNDRRPQLSA